MLKNTSIGTRIYTIMGTFIAIMLLLVAAFYAVSQNVANSSAKLSYEQMLNQQKKSVKDLTLAAAEGLETLVQGKSRDEQLKIITDFASKARFDFEDTGYFFAYEGTTCVVHPVNAKLVGKDLNNVKDANGVYFVRELAQVAADAARGRDNFVSFIFAKPNGQPAPKLGYAINLAGTPFWIGTGVYVDYVDTLVQDLTDNMDDISNNALLYLIAALLVILAIILPVCIAIIRSITRPLTTLTDISAQVAGGNLDVSINTEADEKSKNEVAVMSLALQNMVRALKEKIHEAQLAMEESQKNALQIQTALNSAAKAEQDANTKAEHLLEVAEQLENVAMRLTTTTQSLTDTIHQCEQGASNQASQIAHTSHAMEDMESSVRKVAENASNASHMSASTGEKAHEGQKISHEAIQSMQEVQGLTTHLMNDMQELDASAKSIDQVMGVISEIADQTNLLALNAAIEAARAGEAGRGFAVVADEVRKLAEKTMASTNEVAKIINEIQQHASQSLNQTKASYAAIEKATGLVSQSGDTLAEIHNMTRNAAEQVQSIARAADEQSQTTYNVNSAMNEVNEIALVTAEKMNNATHSVQELKAEAQELAALTKSMKNV